MARIRTIKPEFWTDEKVVVLSPLARLLFVGMWNFVDDEGRAEYSPARMKMQILPADSADMTELLGEIRRENLIVVYAHENKEYYQVCGFSKHQKVDKRSPSKIPPPPNSSESPRIPPTEGKGMEEEGKVERESAGAPTKDYVFEGEVFSLTAKNMAQWQASFNLVPDILAEVRLADAYYAADGEKDKKKLFFKVSQWLKRAHDGEAAKRAKEREAEERMYRVMVKSTPDEDRAAYERQQAEYARLDAIRASEAMH